MVVFLQISLSLLSYIRTGRQAPFNFIEHCGTLLAKFTHVCTNLYIYGLADLRT